ncbi:tubulin epsilon chain [Pelomyxa schiedti]|nr:tubulin epsilon chain [Pelomyxa schiedti]
MSRKYTIGEGGGAIWQDREIRFDIPLQATQLRRGETLVECIDAVEDTKGNNGEHGCLTISNLRLIWYCTKYPKTNLSIGFNCMINITVRVANSKLRGTTQALYVLTKFANTRFEFVFTTLLPTSPKLFTAVQAVYHAYETSRLYRDLKLRGSVVHEKSLLLLLNEEVYSKVDNVWNLSSDQGNLGTFFVTNVRLVWFANLAENFNVSIPYLQMKSIKVRESKFGPALVIETLPQSGGYVLGFRIDPPEKLKAVTLEIQRVHQIFSQEPMFGVVIPSKTTPTPFSFTRQLEDSELIMSDPQPDPMALYFAEANKMEDRPPVYNPEIGLAVESLPTGVTMQSLWSVL